LIFIDKNTNYSDIILQIREKLSQAVHSHLIADAPAGIFLSGGLDSGILALLAQETKAAQIKTLSLYFEDKIYSEKTYQQILLDKLECESHQHLLTEIDFHANLPQILDDMDQPSSDGINTWFTSKFAKEAGLKAVLSGIGADELFGGYPSFKRMKKVKMLESLPQSLLNAGKFTRLKQLQRLGYLGIEGATGKYLFLRGHFIPVDIATQMNMDESEVWKLLREQPGKQELQDLSYGNQASWIETNRYMQNQLLRDADVMSMAHGVEIRFPYLDKEFMHLVYNIHSDIKFKGPLCKQILIDCFKSLLPKPIYKRPKMGFQLPYKDWFMRNEYAKSIMKADCKNYKEFISGKMHWSQFMTLFLVQKGMNE
jgi:asparagine synthase (glutamine-hydrolysing)